MNVLPEKMKALVSYAPGDMRVEMVDVPRADEGEMVVKVEACGICAGDAKANHGCPAWWEGENPYIKAPYIPGHEFVGTIVEVGEGVSGFQTGNRVTSEQIIPCRTCRFCNRGQYWMCKKHDIYGFQNYNNGGMAEYMKFPKGALVYRVPESLPLEKAVLIEPFACGKHTVDRAEIQNEDVVVLAGAGALGLGMVGAIVQKSPKLLIVLDLNDGRLSLAKKFGADLVWNPATTDVVREIMELTDGYGCDVYIEATGHPKAVGQGLDMIRSLGRFVEFSVFNDPALIDWSVIGNGKELNLLGAHLSPYTYPTVIEWLENGKLPADGVVTHVYSIDEWEKAYQMVDRGSESIKVVMVP
jgi:2-desacetyl-2-hydroxyethyl bacteriochlorophyllide A dehydrogenase